MLYKVIILFILIGNAVCTTYELAEAAEPIPEPDYRDSFDKIDEYLEKNVQSKDVGANLIAAKNWLANDLQNDQNKDQNLVEAVQLFISLDTVTKEDSCNESALEILMNNEAAAGSHLLDDDVDKEDNHGSDQEKDVERRTKQIFNFYAEKYGYSCLPADVSPGESGHGENYQCSQNYYEPSYQYYHGHRGYRRRLKYRILRFCQRLSRKLRNLRYRYGHHIHHGPHGPHHGGQVNFQYNKHDGIQIGGKVW